MPILLTAVTAFVPTKLALKHRLLLIQKRASVQISVQRNSLTSSANVRALNRPAVVIVATYRALKYNDGITKAVSAENLEAHKNGENLGVTTVTI